MRVLLVGEQQARMFDGFVGTIVQTVDRTIDETFRLGYQNLNWQRDEDDVTNGYLQPFYPQKRPLKYGGLCFA